MLCSPCLNLCLHWWRCWGLAWMVRTQLPTPRSDLGHGCAVVQFWNCFCCCPGALIGIGQYFCHLFSVCMANHNAWPDQLALEFNCWSVSQHGIFLYIYIYFSARRLYSQWGRNKFWQDWKQENRSKCSDLSLKLGLLFIWSTFLCMEWRRRSVFWGKATLWISAKEFCRSFAMSYVVWRI